MTKNTKKELHKSKREAKKAAELRAGSENLAQREAHTLVIGIDLGDRSSAYCVRTLGQQVVKQASVATTATAILEEFRGWRPQRVVMETGTHSRWVAQLMALLGHEVIVGDARKLKLI